MFHTKRIFLGKFQAQQFRQTPKNEERETSTISSS